MLPGHLRTPGAKTACIPSIPLRTKEACVSLSRLAPKLVAREFLGCQFPRKRRKLHLSHEDLFYEKYRLLVRTCLLTPMLEFFDVWLELGRRSLLLWAPIRGVSGRRRPIV